MCHFRESTTDDLSEFIWSVKTAQQLKEEGKVGPVADHTGSESGHFAYVTGSLDSKDPPMLTDMASQEIGPGGEFPIECVSFKFDLSVSDLFLKSPILTLRQTDRQTDTHTHTQTRARTQKHLICCGL